jgi:hypothetical protein
LSKKSELLRNAGYFWEEHRPVQASRRARKSSNASGAVRGQYVNGIEGPEDYARATVLLDELTDGHELNKYEELILFELEDAILA